MLERSPVMNPNTDAVETPPGPCGVGGWLLFFCILAVVVNPLVALLSVARLTATGPTVAVMAKVAMVAMGCGASLLGILAGIRVWRVSPWALNAVTIYLLSLVLVPLADLVIAARVGLTVDTPALVRSVGFAVVWAAYFSMSKRVKNTFA
jgi:Protein of unknown function (DUF2569)